MRQIIFIPRIFYSQQYWIYPPIYIYIYINPISYNAENEQSRPAATFCQLRLVLLGAKKAHSPQNPNSPIFLYSSSLKENGKLLSLSRSQSFQFSFQIYLLIWLTTICKSYASWNFLQADSPRKRLALKSYTQCISEISASLIWFSCLWFEFQQWLENLDGFDVCSNIYALFGFFVAALSFCLCYGILVL